MKIRINWQSFFIGLGSLFVGMIIPGISDFLIKMVTSIRDMLPFSKKK